MFLKFLTLIIACGFVVQLYADSVEFPDEELASESVLPIFERQEVVKNRAVQTKGRLSLGLGGGFSLTEALYDNKNFNFTATYHLDENHAVNILGQYFFEGLSENGYSLKEGRGLLGNDKFDATLAPYPEYSIFFNYQYTAYYGKISLTKNYVMNLALYAFGGLGTVSLGDTSLVAADIGIGQKFYFTNSLSLRVDLKVAAYKGPDPTAEELHPDKIKAPLPVHSFPEVNYIQNYLIFTMVYLL